MQFNRNHHQLNEDLRFSKTASKIKNTHEKDYIRKRNISLFLILVFLCSLLLQNPAYAQAEQTQVKGIVNLKVDTVYHYDLNGDGKEEKLKYTYSFDEESYKVKLKLYINDKLSFTRTDTNSFCYGMQIFDLDTSDHFLDLYVEARMDSDGVKYANFLRYDGKGIIANTTYKPNKVSKYLDSYRYSIGEVRGDGTFSILMDTPIYSEAIGCFICSMEFKIENNQISNIPSKTYAFTKYSKEYKYKTKKSFTAYKTAGSKSAVFTVKKGNTVTFDMLYVTKSGKAYVRAINDKGKKGWINAGLKDLFYEIPAWG